MRQELRINFRRDLENLVGQLADLADHVVVATDDASRALLTSDKGLAEELITRRWRVDALSDAVDTKTSQLLTLQAPVAGDLRLLVSTLRSSAALRRISDLAVHIAEVVERRSPREVLPARVRPLVTAIVEAVARVTHTAATTIRDGLEPEPELRCLDDKVDELHRKLLQQLTVEESGLTPDVTVDLALLGRYFERIGDQAVNAAVWRLDPVRTAPAQ